VTGLAWTLLGVAAGFAVGDWVALVIRRRSLELVCKPAATVALLGLALALHPASGDRRIVFVVALGLSLAGDVFLMFDRFLPGLASFLVAQVAYAAGFAIGGGSAGEYALGVGIVLVVAVPVAVRLVRALRRGGHGAFVGPVLAYLTAIAAMVTGAIASGNAWAIVGAALFFTSDSLIAEHRFVKERRFTPVAIMVTYHLAQAGLVLSLLR
jgi:uncharacterized membrane protein YhhN